MSILAAFGFIIPSLPVSARPYYALALCLAVIEFLHLGCRHTLRDASIVTEPTGYYRIEAPSSKKVCNLGVFYYFRGMPFPASWSSCGTNTIISQSDLFKDIKSGRLTVEVEGPYGPNLGPLSWTYYWICQALSLIMNLRLNFHERRPSQIISKRQLHFIVDDTAIARVFPLWLWLHKFSHGAKLYHCKLPEEIKIAYEAFMESDSQLSLGQPSQLEVFEVQNSLALAVDIVKKHLHQSEFSKEVKDCLQELESSANKSNSGSSLDAGRPISGILDRLYHKNSATIVDDCVIAGKRYGTFQNKL